MLKKSLKTHVSPIGNASVYRFTSDIRLSQRDLRLMWCNFAAILPG